jgi:hypothetical protein
VVVVVDLFLEIQVQLVALLQQSAAAAAHHVVQFSQDFLVDLEAAVEQTLPR